MDSLDNYSKKIVDYLCNDMSSEERKAFETEISNNEELAEEVDNQSTILENLGAKLFLDEMMSDPHLEEAQKLAEEVLNNRSSRPGTTPSSVSKSKLSIRRIFLSSAAAVIVLLITTSIIFIKPSPEHLYRKYYNPYQPASFIQRSDNINTNLQTKGINAYMKEDYSNAVTYFSQLQDIQSLNTESSFLLGLSHMANSDFNNAAEVFNHLLLHETYLIPEVKWYLGLTYIKLEKFNEAQKLFGELANNKTNFGQKAKHLEQKLPK